MDFNMQQVGPLVLLLKLEVAVFMLVASTLCYDEETEASSFCFTLAMGKLRLLRDQNPLHKCSLNHHHHPPPTNSLYP